MKPAIAMLIVPLLACATWSARLINESGIASTVFASPLWIVFARPLLLASLGCLLASVTISIKENCTRLRFWLWCFYCAALFCLPYVPDMFGSFSKAGAKNPLLLSAAFYGLGILTYGLVRGLCCISISSLKIHSYAPKFIRISSLYVFTLIIEFLVFHNWHPITWFPAQPFPLPISKKIEFSEPKKIGLILLETNIDGEQRLKIERGGFPELVALGERISQIIKHKTKNKLLEERLTVILPEALVYLQDKNEARFLLQSTADMLGRETSVKELVWIQGAFMNNTNVVLATQVGIGAGLNEEKSAARSKISILRIKREHIPMFEAASMGISYTPVNDSIRFVEETPPPEQTGLVSFVSQNQILICYESLYPQNWKFKKQTLVLTNHHLFNNFRLMDWVYIGIIRQFSFLFQSQTTLVANAGQSGLLPGGLLFSNADNNASDGNWTVVEIN